jgi:hypothetical protein
MRRRSLSPIYSKGSYMLELDLERKRRANARVCRFKNKTMRKLKINLLCRLPNPLLIRRRYFEHLETSPTNHPRPHLAPSNFPHPLLHLAKSALSRQPGPQLQTRRARIRQRESHPSHAQSSAPPSSNPTQSYAPIPSVVRLNRRSANPLTDLGRCGWRH